MDQWIYSDRLREVKEGRQRLISVIISEKLSGGYCMSKGLNDHHNGVGYLDVCQSTLRYVVVPFQSIGPKAARAQQIIFLDYNTKERAVGILHDIGCKHCSI